MCGRIYFSIVADTNKRMDLGMRMTNDIIFGLAFNDARGYQFLMSFVILPFPGLIL